MKVGVGYCDNPDSVLAGKEASRKALQNGGLTEPCDMVLLFGTATHSHQELLDSVQSVVGDQAQIYGGGGVGIITNDTYGYAGNQVGVACFWMENSACSVYHEKGLLASEKDTGYRLGQQLKEAGVKEDTSAMLFYDGVDHSKDGVRLLMATWLLEGMKKGLGFLPPLTGAGLQGDHVCTPTPLVIDGKLTEHEAMALVFSDDIQIDHAIMHGCEPASTYHTVTKAEGPVILEIDGEPAIPFVDRMIESVVMPEQYPFFLTFGINHGKRWEPYNESNYASRLCLGIDKERDGIVMFEPDMVSGTKFQLMFRANNLEYMKPKIESLFQELGDREPVLGIYIDCAGRCAGYGGRDIEDALVLQEVVGDKVPVLGVYTGVEIAPIGGRARGLDWTGVFCLLTQSKDSKKKSAESENSQATSWEDTQKDDSDEIPLDGVISLSNHNAAKILELDNMMISIRHELEQKRRGFSLLSELSVSLRTVTGQDSVFIPVARRLNAVLNMQKTVVLVPHDEGGFIPSVLQGYTPEEIMDISQRRVNLEGEMLDEHTSVIVTAADSEERLKEIREVLKLPYFISSPVTIQNKKVAILITGRTVEQTPFLSRLGESDVETIQSIAALLSSVLAHQRLETAEERSHIMVGSMPLSCVFWDENGKPIDCNKEALYMFESASREDFIIQFPQMIKEQKDGGFTDYVMKAFIDGHIKFEWSFRTHVGTEIPTEITLVRVPMGENYCVVGYLRDLREQKAAMDELQRARAIAEGNLKQKNEFLASVGHEVRTPLNSILAMANEVKNIEGTGESTQIIIEKGIHSAHILNSTVESILDFSDIEAGKIELESKEFNPKQVVENLGKLFEDTARKKGLYIKTEIDSDIPEGVLGDRAKFEQIIYNIMSNGVKFTAEGGVTVRLKKESKKFRNKVGLWVEVEDTGRGISDAGNAGLFTPLTQMDMSYSKKQEGLGMGLAISKGLAKLMKGDVTYQQIKDKGSLFGIHVIFDIPKTHIVKEEISLDEQKKRLSGMRVLVVEDNEINRIIMGELLKKAGVEVFYATNGVEAVKLVKEQSLDIVLMDIQMPEMDGLTATTLIRENHEFDDMPILAMTAHASKEHREESKRCGMNDHLTKPVDVEEVYRALEYWRK
ncbi:signal transduction histidine kinase/BarA-like signal transduction histidine kinase [Aequitasia blattaphilus]|uniref:Stage 0 sporulation protein A homolog n=1 Tax=Aequitasia blattaphilus TaxID=2949332 RepID=A0ABT1E6F9_9FIRM|nr:response regulator [Aequitasia blattaphilus]MCP1101423.1 response regulator [Aequitasia blattaphilus]MCR8614063.1 response regulator [Aequitasia blattaphilus]